MFVYLKNLTFSKNVFKFQNKFMFFKIMFAIWKMFVFLKKCSRFQNNVRLCEKCSHLQNNVHPVWKMFVQTKLSLQFSKMFTQYKFRIISNFSILFTYWKKSGNFRKCSRFPNLFTNWINVHFSRIVHKLWYVWEFHGCSNFQKEKSEIQKNFLFLKMFSFVKALLQSWEVFVFHKTLRVISENNCIMKF